MSLAWVWDYNIYRRLHLLTPWWDAKPWGILSVMAISFIILSAIAIPFIEIWNIAWCQTGSTSWRYTELRLIQRLTFTKINFLRLSIMKSYHWVDLMCAREVAWMDMALLWNECKKNIAHQTPLIEWHVCLLSWQMKNVFLSLQHVLV